MGFGANTSQQSASGWSQSASDSFAQSQGGSANFAESGQRVYGAQEPALAQNFQRTGSAVDASMRAIDQYAPTIQNAATSLLQPGGRNPALSAYADQVGEEFRDVILPQITGEAGLANAVGGSRRRVAEGIAATGAQRNIQRFAGQQYQADQDRRASTLGILPQLQAMFTNPVEAGARAIGGPTTLGSSLSMGSSFQNSLAQSTSRSASAQESQGSAYGFDVKAVPGP